MKQLFYSVKEAAAILSSDFSNQDLYYFLMKDNIVDSQRRPKKEYIEKGILIEVYGSRCSWHSNRYPATKFTKKGLRWLKNEFYPKIEKELQLGNVG